MSPREIGGTFLVSLEKKKIIKKGAPFLISSEHFYVAFIFFLKAT
jgi:hypothetical protein